MLSKYKAPSMDQESKKMLMLDIDKINSAENIVKNEFKEKVKRLAKYFKEVNHKYPFTKISNELLLKKLKDLFEKTQNKVNEDRFIVKFGKL